MANKKTKNNTVNILIIVCTVLVIALVGLIAYSVINESKGNEIQVPDMVAAIEALDIKQNPVATIEMENGGIIKAELYPKIAPNTVCNFIELANSGFYDGLIFHRCIKDFMIQGGDPQGTGMGDPGYSIAGEFTNNGFKNDLKHERGVLSMARAKAPDTAGSQFFIMHQDYPSLDNEYASFGKVIEGMEVVDAIATQETDGNDKPLTPQVIKKITVETFGVEYPKSEKL